MLSSRDTALRFREKDETQPLLLVSTQRWKNVKKCKKAKVLLTCDGLSEIVKKCNFCFKHTILTCDATCFKLERDG